MTLVFGCDSVTGDDQFGVGQWSKIPDLTPELDLDAEIRGPGCQAADESLAADAEAVPTRVDCPPVVDVDDLVRPAERVRTDRPGGLRIIRVELLDQLIPINNAPPVGLPGRVAFEHGDVVVLIGQLQQYREEEPGGPASDTGDLHGESVSFTGIRRSEAATATRSRSLVVPAS